MLNDILGQINDLMYTYLLLFLLLGTGLYFSIRSRFAQVRLMKEGFRILTEKAEVEDGKRQVSSFQALMISTASRVGTGNIAGIATAIAAGGPGAVFWMWVMAVIGSASAFIESTLAQVYKTKDGKDFRGGPSYYMEKALGKRWMGVLFSVLLIICFAYGFNGLQSYNMSSALEYYIPGYSESSYPMIVGLILAVGTGLIIFGGVHRIGFITSVMVPIMAGAYLLMGLFTIVTHLPQLPGIFAMILSEAFESNYTEVKWFHQSKNKKARILSNATWIMNHVHYPVNWRDKWPEYYNAMVKYQREGDNRHDDGPDATTGVAETMNMLGA